MDPLVPDGNNVNLVCLFFVTYYYLVQLVIKRPVFLCKAKFVERKSREDNCASNCQIEKRWRSGNSLEHVVLGLHYIIF